MYGGHITDAWDRRTCNVYLQVYQHIGLFEGSELATGFKSPIPDEMDYKDYITYTETSMPSESPPLFGLHPNTEIGYLTNSADRLLFEILSISGGWSGEGESGNTNDAVRQTMNTLLERLLDEFEMVNLNLKAKPLLPGHARPCVVVALQECRRMNPLLREIRRSLVD